MYLLEVGDICGCAEGETLPFLLSEVDVGHDVDMVIVILGTSTLGSVRVSRSR